METARNHTFTNSAGRTLEVLPVSPWLLDSIPTSVEAQWMEVGKVKPTPPTYEVTTATDLVETHAHFYRKNDKGVIETSLEKPEEFAAWDAYQAEVRAWNRDYMEAQLRVCIGEGVAEVDASALTPWRVRMKRLRIPVPSDPADEKLLYIKTEYLVSNEDTKRFIALFYALTHLPQEALRIAEEAFRRALEEYGRPETERTGTGTGGYARGELDDERKDGGSKGGAGNGKVEKRVGRRERVG